MAEKQRILIVDDDANIAELISLCRVRTRAQLVKKTEGPGIGFI